MGKCNQVGNLDDSVDDRGLSELFAAYGMVRRARVATHPGTGRSSGVGFVEMGCDERGDAAIAALVGREHRGRVLSVCWSRPRRMRGRAATRPA